MAMAACLFAGIRLPVAAAPTFEFADGVLVVRTSRYEVTWQNGSMARLITHLPERREWTVAPGPMSVSLLPNGPGSFSGAMKAGLDQHRVVWSHDLAKGPPGFPAQHPPMSNSRVEFAEIPGGGRITYTGLANDTTAALTQELTVDAKTSDLVIRQSASSASPGLFGIGFSLLNLRPDIEFAVPYFGGQRFGGALGRGQAVGYAWPKFWSAGMVIGEMPGGGSFLVYADDPGLGPKYLKLYNSEAAQGVGLEANAQWPYAERKEVFVCSWRFNTFAGNWVEPAQRYRDWLATTFQLKPWTERPAAWIKDIALVWMTYLDQSAMREFSRKLDPRNVLILNLGWAKGFNRNAPHYQPNSAKLAEAVQAAHDLGYRYGVYAAHKLIDRHAHPDLFAKYDLKLAFDGLSQAPSALDTLVDQEKNVAQIAKSATGSYLAEIHPGRKAWIEFYSGLMAGFRRDYGIDLFYEDVTGANCGSSGIVDGLSLHEGTRACDRRIQELLPEVAAAGEYWNEVNVAAGQEFGLQNFATWFNRDHLKRLATYAHPLMGAIFNDFCRYISFRTPIRDVETFHLDQNYLEVMGAMPVWTATPDAATAEAHVVLERARLIAGGFKPYYPAAEWGKGVVAWLRDAQGHLVQYVRDGDSTYCWRGVGAGRRLCYARVKGVTALALPEPVTIDGWVAYGKSGPIGLSPEKWYCAFPGRPRALPLTITDLPAGVHVAGVRMTPEYGLVELKGTGTGTVRWAPAAALAGRSGVPMNSADVTAPTALVFSFSEPPTAEVHQPLPLDRWNIVKVANGLVTGPAAWKSPPQAWTLGDEKLDGYIVEPETGGEGTEVSIDGYLCLPADRTLALAVSLGRLGGAGDGVNFVVRVNGESIWKQFSRPGQRGWTPVTVPLGAFAGQVVVLSLAVDCGPKGSSTSNDQALWGAPRLVPQKTSARASEPAASQAAAEN